MNHTDKKRLIIETVFTAILIIMAIFNVYVEITGILADYKDTISTIYFIMIILFGVYNLAHIIARQP